jgi:hypothetical protein
MYHDAFFDELADFLPHLTMVKFLGGEPFLQSEAMRVMDMLVERGLRPTVHATTNGTQWTPRVRRIIESLPFEVAVSLDAATPEVYEQIRIGSSWNQVQRNLDLYQEHCQAVTVTYCLMRPNWQDFGRFCQQADERGIGCAVNVVTEPRAVSLYTLAPDELEPIVAELEAEDARIRSSLTLSLPVWSGELEKLRRHVERLRGDGLIPGLQDRRFNEEFPAPFAPQQKPEPVEVAPADDVQELFDRWLGAELGRVSFDEFDQVSSVENETDRLRLPLGELKGKYLQELLPFLEGQLGAISGYAVLASAEEIVVYEATFEKGTVIRALMAPRVRGSRASDGPTLVLADRPTS